MTDNSKERKGVKYPDVGKEFTDGDQHDIIVAINNHEDWGGSSFTLQLTEHPETILDLRKNSKGQWIIW